MDKMRERFEAAIKRPPGVFWNEASGEYDGSQSYYAQLAETYQAAWDAWQAALSQAEPVEKTFGEGIDVSYQDLFSQWQADHELQLKTEKPAPLPQPVASDVEEFIAAHDYDKEDMCSGCVPSSALREWMAGHARVQNRVIVNLVDALKDARSGMRCIRQTHGDLYGIGFDRVEKRSTEALRDLESCLLTASKEPHNE